MSRTIATIAEVKLELADRAMELLPGKILTGVGRIYMGFLIGVRDGLDAGLEKKPLKKAAAEGLKKIEVD